MTVNTFKKQFAVLPKTKWSASRLWEFKSRSFVPLCISLILVGIGEGFLLVSNLGSAPWTILSQGIALQTEVSVGVASFIVSCLVMLCWFPLHLKIGLGTVLNIILIAIALGVTAKMVASPATALGQIGYAVIGILLMGIGSAFYLTCHMGAGPRDGLMVGLCQRFKLKVGLVRPLMESSVALIGFLLGGTLGFATLLFAFSIGWVIQLTLYCFTAYDSK
ncbi:YitT family protein [Pasteurellaceae bacterium USgator11]|nr:YitT family protein [Pasteurellaceae bacterium UScroc12]TNG97668.1 YitT family protein [Pasteurellaceae bacterium USgator41]TNH01504.1 YitT family protein [Pasteurellaceae bacterium UScroc31]TNH02603.1 YitT family protein [Pasteurellaceae bacterium USgator11]